MNHAMPTAAHEPTRLSHSPGAAALHPGAHPDATGTTFVVLATRARTVSVRLFDEKETPTRTIPLEPRGDGWFASHLEGVSVGALYKLVLDDDVWPDPYARALPFGVHGPARVEPRGEVEPLRNPPPPHGWIIYELHVGTFSDAGTFRGVIEHLDELAALGVNAIELLPIAAFAGERGWGYDGVALYAPHAPYGTPDDLRALIRAAHDRGLAVVLDAVYNHFGPAGNYLSVYAPEYFTSAVKTPWGDSPSYGWGPMRSLVLDNVRYWLDEFGLDGLRLDATHEIHDDASEVHILREATALVESRGRRAFFEDERNDPDVVRRLGASGVWADDFHHQVHVLLTGERDGYYGAYEPTVTALAANIVKGWTFAGEPYPPWKGRARGKEPEGLSHEHLVLCIQNHDQVGNRAVGDRLTATVGLDAYRAATALLLFLPTTPLLFMGQEWAASTPFAYFSDHGGDLGKSVSEGRKSEFASFSTFGEAAHGAIPDPEARSTFEASRLSWAERERGDHASVLDLYRRLLHLRKTDLVLSAPCERRGLHARVTPEGLLEVVRHGAGGTRTLLVSFDASPKSVTLPEGASALVWTSDAPLTPGVFPPNAAVIFAS